MWIIQTFALALMANGIFAILADHFITMGDLDRAWRATIRRGTKGLAMTEEKDARITELENTNALLVDALRGWRYFAKKELEWSFFQQEIRSYKGAQPKENPKALAVLLAGVEADLAASPSDWLREVRAKECEDLGKQIELDLAYGGIGAHNIADKRAKAIREGKS